jgi:class 3 adenylate cyclase
MTVSQQQWFAQFRDAGGLAAGDVSLSGMDSYGVVRWLRVPADGLRPLSVVVAESLGATVAPGLHRIEYLLPDARGTSPFPVYEILPPLVRQFPPAEWVSGKIVLIGAVRPFEDRHLTPLNALSRSNGDRLPGVLIHANAIEQWLAPRPIVPAPPYDALLLAVALACLAVPLVFGQVAVWKRALASVSGLCLLEFTSLALYRHRVVELPLLAPPVAFAVAAGLLSAHLSRQYSRQRRFLRETFGHYLAPAVIDHLIDHPEAVRLGGEVRDVTCLFTDIEEFTALAETLPPERLTELMNNYLEGAVDILFAHQGTLDKFVGDAIVAFFGAPGEQHDHAERAVRCALALDRYAREFASQQHAQGVPLGRTRIGVHSGMVVVGNFGSIRHFNYTVLGDTVNTAARLEGANKHLGTTIAISESSAVRCGDVARRPAAKLMLKGKSEAVAVWEPLQSDAVELMYLVEYGEFIERLERGEVEAARALLQRLRGIAPGDPLLQLHWRRIEAGEASLEMSLDSK